MKFTLLVSISVVVAFAYGELPDLNKMKQEIENKIAVNLPMTSLANKMGL